MANIKLKFTMNATLQILSTTLLFTLAVSGLHAQTAGQSVVTESIAIDSLDASDNRVEVIELDVQSRKEGYSTEPVVTGGEPIELPALETEFSPPVSDEPVTNDDLNVVKDAPINYYGPVKSGDTVWAILRTIQGAGDFSMAQKAMALYHINADKFTRSNVNGLRTGVVLRMPTASDISARTVAQADLEFKAHAKVWGEVGNKADLTPSQVSLGQIASSSPDTKRDSKLEADIFVPQPATTTIIESLSFAAGSHQTTVDSAEQGSSGKSGEQVIPDVPADGLSPLIDKFSKNESDDQGDASSQSLPPSQEEPLTVAEDAVVANNDPTSDLPEQSPSFFNIDLLWLAGLIAGLLILGGFYLLRQPPENAGEDVDDDVEHDLGDGESEGKPVATSASISRNKTSGDLGKTPVSDDNSRYNLHQNESVNIKDSNLYTDSREKGLTQDSDQIKNAAYSNPARPSVNTRREGDDNWQMPLDQESRLREQISLAPDRRDLAMQLLRLYFEKRQHQSFYDLVDNINNAKNQEPSTEMEYPDWDENEWQEILEMGKILHAETKQQHQSDGNHELNQDRDEPVDEKINQSLHTHQTSDSSIGPNDDADSPDTRSLHIEKSEDQNPGVHEPELGDPEEHDLGKSIIESDDPMAVPDKPTGKLE